MIKNFSASIHNQVLHLSSWPSLIRLSQESVPDVTRICALLARRPSVGMFVPLVLNMSPLVAYSLLETLYASGHIYSDKMQVTRQPSLAEEFASHQEPAVISFIARLWQRLAGSHLPEPKLHTTGY